MEASGSTHHTFVAFSEMDCDEEPLFSAFSSYMEADPKEWTIDSGATAHMCNDISFFSSIKQLKNPKRIIMGNTTAINTEYIGEIQISVGDSNTATITNVLYTPQMAKNLISVEWQISSV
jgi:hypothetical protein